MWQTLRRVFIPLRDDNPRARFPAVTLLLIAANVVAFLFELSLNARGQKLLTLEAGAIPYEIVHRVDIYPRNLLPIPGSIWTSMFLHGGWMHLIGNMWFLWIFGDNVEEAMGSFRYLLFYFLVGTVGALAQCYAMPDSTAPMIGASGAIAGVLGGYILIYPRARVLTLIFLIIFFTFLEIPAYFFLFIWFAQQAVFGAIDLTNPNGGGGGVAYFAHVGGFAFGLLAIKLFATRRSAAYGQPKYPVY
jgi:membrane associated rhomboid family serine protease